MPAAMQALEHQFMANLPAWLQRLVECCTAMTATAGALLDGASIWWEQC